MPVSLKTPRQLSAELGITETTLATWRCRSRGPSFIKVGAAVRYAEDQVQTWLASRQRPTRDSATAGAPPSSGARSA